MILSGVKLPELILFQEILLSVSLPLLALLDSEKASAG